MSASKRVVPELRQDIFGELRAVVGAAAHVGDRFDLAAGDTAGFLECGQRDRLAGEERLGAGEADDRRRYAAVRDACGVDVAVRGTQTNGGGEGGDIEIFAAAHLVQLERVADDGHAHARDDLVRPQVELLVAEVEVVDLDGARAPCNLMVQLQLRAGYEQIRQGVADGRAVGDVAGQRPGVLD